MTSQAFLQDRFPDPSPPLEASEDANGKTLKRANVYDSVAGQLAPFTVDSFSKHPTGKISSGGYIPKYLSYSSARDTPASSAKPVAPENVLFRLKNAPIRYEESDIYFTNERRSVTNLPESDLLKAIHCYASDFYSRAVPNAGTGDWKTFDETALLAMGILMEEAARESIGRTGDLVFTEGEELGILKPRSGRSNSQRPSKRRRIET